jgi:hypothetical protein
MPSITPCGGGAHHYTLCKLYRFGNYSADSRTVTLDPIKERLCGAEKKKGGRGGKLPTHRIWGIPNQGLTPPLRNLLNSYQSYSLAYSPGSFQRMDNAR